jgi:hypothetical protein
LPISDFRLIGIDVEVVIGDVHLIYFIFVIDDRKFLDLDLALIDFGFEVIIVFVHFHLNAIIHIMCRMPRLGSTRGYALVTVIVVLSSTAHAQSIGAGATLNIKRVSGEADVGVLDTRSAGVTVFVRAPATPHVSFALEIDVEREAEMTTTTEANRIQLQTRYGNRMHLVSALAVIHPLQSGRVRWSVLGGLTFVHFERTITLDPAGTILGTAVQPPRSTFVDRMGAATVGIDVDLIVSPHVAIVPAVRAHTFRLSSHAGGFSVRPSIGARWMF